ncbi:hypothetical protein GW17_00004109 [Ensete ventricosum]|nr:hypothetical protein GW17_00004109 [Ensete ventricosum]
MAGGGKRGEASSLLLVTLLVTLLAFFATNSSAARVTNPSAIPRQSGTECDGGTARWTVLHLRVSSHLPTFLVPLRRRMARLLPFRLHQLRVCPQRVHLRRSCRRQGLRGRLLCRS